jgi:hypothetical protein
MYEGCKAGNNFASELHSVEEADALTERKKDARASVKKRKR